VRRRSRRHGYWQGRELVEIPADLNVPEIELLDTQPGRTFLVNEIGARQALVAP
jgi:hypothetical protein